MKRLLASSSVATMVVFGLFVVMMALIQQHAPATTIETRDVSNVLILEQPETRKPHPHRQPPKLKQDKRPQTIQKQKTNTKPKIDVIDASVETMSKFHLGTVSNNTAYLGDGNQLQNIDRQATALVMIEPIFPIAAAKKNLEGWVKLRYDINLTGRVENVRVVDAKPRGIFEHSAKKALYRWKYKPSIVDGKAVASNGHVVMLEFNFEKE